MDCRKVQRLAEDLAGERLPEPVARAVRQHLAECTDCRVLQQQSARLRQLLALKRYEHPGPDYYAGIADDFHARLAAANARPGWWARLLPDGQLPFLRPWSYALAGACGLGAVLVLTWIGLRPTTNASRPAAVSAVTVQPPLLVTGTRATAAPASLLRNDPSVFPWPDVAALTGNAVSVAAPTPSSRAHYVLDQIAITPASYDVATVDF